MFSRIKLKYVAVGVLFIMVLVSCIAWLFFWWSEKKRIFSELTDNIPHVGVAAVGFEYIRPITRAEVLVKPKKMADVISYLNAQVLETYVRDGQNVTKGQMIALLDTDELEREIIKADEKISSAQAELDNITIEVGRSEILAQASALSQKLLGDVKTKQVQAKNNLAIAQLDKDNLVNRINKKVITSPMDGKLVKLYAQVGMAVKQGGVLASIANTLDVEARAMVNEDYDAAFEVGDAVDIVFESIPDKAFSGNIVRIKDNKQSGRTSSVELDIPFVDKDGDISSYYATIYNAIIRERTNNCVLSLPRSAFLFEERKVFVYVLRPDSTVVRRRVEVAGIAGNDASSLKVNEGVTEGEYVVVKNLDKLSAYSEKVIVD